MGLVLVIDGQLEIEAVEDVDVRENSQFLELGDRFAFNIELVALVLQNIGDEAGTIGEDVDVDVGALANVPGHDAADEARLELT